MSRTRYSGAPIDQRIMQELKRDGGVLTTADLAHRIGCVACSITAQAAALIKRGAVVRGGGRGAGYYYHLPEWNGAEPVKKNEPMSDPVGGVSQVTNAVSEIQKIANKIIRVKEITKDSYRDMELFSDMLDKYVKDMLALLPEITAGNNRSMVEIQSLRVQLEKLDKTEKLANSIFDFDDREESCPSPSE